MPGRKKPSLQKWPAQATKRDANSRDWIWQDGKDQGSVIMIQTRQPSRTTALQNGQLWRVDDFNVQIKHVGKRLVHYQRAKGEIKRATVAQMSGKQALEDYFREHNAVLIREGKA